MLYSRPATPLNRNVEQTLLGSTFSATIFYSWQSDTRPAANRTLIQDALEAAIAEIHAESSLTLEPVMDRDTFGVAGSPDIGATILRKIDAAHALVADVTIVTPPDAERPSPNPNVLIELGYGLKALGAGRVLLVQNLAFGSPESLPFDLRQKRVVTYNSPAEADSRAAVRRLLQRALRSALSLVFLENVTPPAMEYPIDLDIRYEEKRISSDEHIYTLVVLLTNTGTKPIREWNVDVEIPTRLLLPSITYARKLEDRSDRDTSFFRTTERSHPGTIYPGDTKSVMTIDYHVDREIWDSKATLFARDVRATAFVHGAVSATAARTVSELQCF